MAQAGQSQLSNADIPRSSRGQSTLIAAAKCIAFGDKIRTFIVAMRSGRKKYIVLEYYKKPVVQGRSLFRNANARNGPNWLEAIYVRSDQYLLYA